MKFPELRFVKFAAASAITEPETVGESVERSCLAFGMLGSLALAKKEAGALSKEDQRVMDKVARVCRNTHKFAKVLRNSMKFLDGEEALHRTLSELSFGAMSSKVAYTKMIPVHLFDREFESLDMEKVNRVATKLASMANTEKLLKIADIMEDGGVDDLDDEGEDIEQQMKNRMRSEEDEEEEDEEEEQEEGMESADDIGQTIPPDLLSQLLQQLHSSYYEPLNEGMGMAEGEESDTAEVARMLAQLGAGDEQPDSIAPILASLSMAGQNA